MRVAFALLIVVAFVRGSRADQNTALQESARQHFKKGTTLWEVGDYTAAIEELKKSYLEWPKPQTLYALGQAYRKHGDLSLALGQYQLYLAKDPNGSYRDDVKQAIAEVEREIAENRATAPPHGVPPTPEAEQPRKESSPTHAPTAGPPSTPTTRTMPVAAALPSVETLHPWYKSGAGWGLSVGGVVVAAVGAGLLGYAATIDGQIRTAPSLDARNALRQSETNYQIAGGTLLGVGGAALVSGVVVFALAGRSRHAAPVGFRVVPVGGGVLVNIGGNL